ncbi:uncharacterized protein LOC131669626 [Phymastichus coffea]|uniref:uncharacterized protein LOC131669626 n=1 Tax=Phymastichus coffea TaxID=108790 RepID=UPI00273BFBBD|nr:uncharacterized protein LOC131669626 [Phymastichus coffea]
MDSNDEMDTSDASTSRHGQSSPNEDDESTPSKKKEEKEGDNEVCLLCDKPMTESTQCTVKKVGTQNFIRASLKRKDKKHEDLEKLDEIKVHKTCQRTYTRESNIKIALKQATQANQRNRKRRRDGRNFDIFSYCFFCSNKMFNTQKCSRVTKKSTIDNVIAQLDVYEPFERSFRR